MKPRFSISFLPEKVIDEIITKPIDEDLKTLNASELIVGIGLTPKMQVYDQKPLLIIDLEKNIASVGGAYVVKLKIIHSIILNIGDDFTPSSEEIFSLLETVTQAFANKYGEMVQHTAYEQYGIARLDKGEWLARIDKTVANWASNTRHLEVDRYGKILDNRSSTSNDHKT
jgi:hypothetical protein